MNLVTINEVNGDPVYFEVPAKKEKVIPKMVQMRTCAKERTGKENRWCWCHVISI